MLCLAEGEHNSIILASLAKPGLPKSGALKTNQSYKPKHSRHYSCLSDLIQVLCAKLRRLSKSIFLCRICLVWWKKGEFQVLAENSLWQLSSSCSSRPLGCCIPHSEVVPHVCFFLGVRSSSFSLLPLFQLL